MRFLHWYEVYARLTAVLAGIAAGLLLLMAFWITYDVAVRNLFDMASPWAFDLSEYTLVWVTFLAAPWVLLNDRHIRIELLIDVLPARYQRAFGVAVSLVAIAACAVLTWRCGIAAFDYFSRGDMMPRIWRIPRIMPYVVVPVGAGLLTLAFVFRLGLYLSVADPETMLRGRAVKGQSTGAEPDEGPGS